MPSALSVVAMFRPGLLLLFLSWIVRSHHAGNLAHFPNGFAMDLVNVLSGRLKNSARFCERQSLLIGQVQDTLLGVGETSRQPLRDLSWFGISWGSEGVEPFPAGVFQGEPSTAGSGEAGQFSEPMPQDVPCPSAE